MSYLWRGNELLLQCEWTTSTSVNKHAIAGSNYKLGGKTLTAAGKAPVSTASGFLYEDETFRPTGFKLAGKQVVLQAVGCRPRTGVRIFGSTTPGTAYINRFSDGEVWVSSSANSRSGTKISSTISSMQNPRGIRYLMVCLVGAGGGGGGANLTTSGCGGGAGAAAHMCIQLPQEGYARVVIGAGGAGGGSAAGGSDGNGSAISCGDFYFSCGGGHGGEKGGLGNKGGAGGGLSYGAGYSGLPIIVANGSAGGDRHNGGSGYVWAFNDHTPEGARVEWQSADSVTTGSGGGGGGGNPRASGADGGNRAGSAGNAPGGGGSGGGFVAFNQNVGGAGANGGVYLYY